MVREILPKIIIIYADENGNEPYTEWLESLKTRER